MPNWTAFRSNLGDISSTLANQARQKQAQEDAIKMMFQKALIESKIKQQLKEQDPYNQLMTRMMQRWLGGTEEQSQIQSSQAPQPPMPKRIGIPSPSGISQFTSQQQTMNSELSAPSNNIVPSKSAGASNYEFVPSFGPSGISFRAQLKPGEELKQKVEEKKALSKVTITATQKQDIAGAKQQLMNVRQMEDLAKDLPGGYRGMIGIGIGSITRGAVESGTRRYLKKLPAFAAGLYRDLTGDKRLSDMDAQARAMPLLWHPSEDKSIREDVFADIEKALKARIDLLEKGEFITDEYGQAITPIESVMKGIKSQNNNKFQQSDPLGIR